MIEPSSVGPSVSDAKTLVSPIREIIGNPNPDRNRTGQYTN